MCDNDAAEKTLRKDMPLWASYSHQHISSWFWSLRLLIFGPRKLPELGKGLGEGLKGFKDGIKGMGQPEPTTKQDAAPTTPKNEPIQPS